MEGLPPAARARGLGHEEVVKNAAAIERPKQSKNEESLPAITRANGVAGSSYSTSLYSLLEYASLRRRTCSIPRATIDTSRRRGVW
jgi:hypothetical protein